MRKRLCLGRELINFGDESRPPVPSMEQIQHSVLAQARAVSQSRPAFTPSATPRLVIQDRERAREVSVCLPAVVVIQTRQRPEVRQSSVPRPVHLVRHKNNFRPSPPCTRSEQA
jgi:hypothetical protein